MGNPNDSLELSPAGIALLKDFESCRLKAYQDVRGVWTIGYGHTGPEVVANTIWTQQQADNTLEEDVCWAVKAVHESVSIVLHQYQFDPLVIFTFNVGANAFQKSTLLRLLNANNIGGAAAQFMNWIYAGDLISSGLVNRRKAEQAMFNGVQQ